MNARSGLTRDRILLTVVSREPAWLEAQLTGALSRERLRLRFMSPQDVHRTSVALVVTDDIHFPPTRTLLGRLCNRMDIREVWLASFDKPGSLRALLGLPIAEVFLLPSEMTAFCRSVERASSDSSAAALADLVSPDLSPLLSRVLSELFKHAQSETLAPPPASVTALSAVMGVSRSHLSRAASRDGVNLRRVLDLLRVRWALNHRQECQSPGRELAEMLGFESSEGLRALIVRTSCGGLRNLDFMTLEEMTGRIAECLP